MQTTPAIKVDVNLIALTATVVGRKDQFVPDLQKEDFVVSEDGVPQEIAVFQKEEVPARVGIDFDTSGSMVVLRNNLIVSLPRTQSDFGQTQLS